MMPLEDCLGAAQECNAPMVSICGGEPLIYPHIEALINGLSSFIGAAFRVCPNTDSRLECLYFRVVGNDHRYAAAAVRVIR